MTTPAINPDFKLSRARPTPCDITNDQRRLWVDTRTALLWSCPAFTYLLFNMMNPDASKDIAYWTKDVPIAATDGEQLFLNPDRFFGYKLQERVFIVAHEIMHCILNHCALMHTWSTAQKVDYPSGKSLPWDKEDANVAADFIINDVLIDSRVGQFSTDWLHDPKTAGKDDAFHDAYAKVYKQKPSGGGGKNPGNNPGGNGQGQGQGQGKGQSFDQHLAPGTGQGKDPTQAAQERAGKQQEWKTAIAAAKAQGTLPGALERIFNDLLKPEVDWTEIIRGFFARKVGSGANDWRRADRRWIGHDIFFPARSGNGAGTVVVAIDTSGSIGQLELDHFFAEMRGIIDDVRPREIVLIWCDAAIGGVDIVTETQDLGGLKPKGGGGTSFLPPFQWVEDNNIKPDALVYLTDLCGPFPPSPPAYPVCWGRTVASLTPPWGDVVDIPLKG